jgi:glycosyltransferase involved in cell wall biosynthesis
MAEINTRNQNYDIDIYTSNAIDFKALRAPEGKFITKNDKNYDFVNNLKINRFPVDYQMIKEEKISIIQDLDEFKQLNISNECLNKFVENGPFLFDVIEYFLNHPKKRYDLIHTTFFPYFNLLISLIIGKIIRKPTICTPFFHFSNPRYVDTSLIEVLRKFDLLIACTNLEKKVLMEMYDISEKKIKVIPMGVDFNIFDAVHKTKLKDYYFKEKFFNNREKKYKMVLFCGYKNYEKGAISILKSIPLVLKKLKKVYFIFIGPSTMAFNRELSRIQKLVNAKIINFTPDNLTGYYDKKKLTAFSETDVFLMPSRSDAFGIAFLEAWASGKPVIGANIGATPEVIRENIDGLLVEFDNPQDISEKLLMLLKKKHLRQELGFAGKTRVEENYTWDIIAEKTHNVYQSLINNEN